MPILAYAYRDAPWSADIRFPFRADVRYALSDWVRVGGESFVQGGEFSIHDPAASVDTVRYSAQRVGGLIAFGPVRGPQFQVDAGTTMHRHYTGMDSGSTVVSLGFRGAGFYRAGVAVRF